MQVPLFLSCALPPGIQIHFLQCGMHCASRHANTIVSINISASRHANTVVFTTLSASRCANTVLMMFSASRHANTNVFYNVFCIEACNCNCFYNMFCSGCCYNMFCIETCKYRCLYNAFCIEACKYRCFYNVFLASGRCRDPSGSPRSFRTGFALVRSALVSHYHTGFALRAHLESIRKKNLRHLALSHWWIFVSH